MTAILKFALVVLPLMCLSGIAWAQTRVAQEFRVNSQTDGNQTQPLATSLGSSGFVVAWHSFTPTSFHRFVSVVEGQIYDDAGGPVGSELSLARGVIPGSWSTAGLGSGGFVVTWVAETGGVFGMQYSASGAAIGPGFLVASDSSALQTSVAALNDGGFVVIWATRNGTGTWTIHGQRFTSASAPVGGVLRVNTTTLFDAGSPRVAGLSKGGFVVTWTGTHEKNVPAKEIDGRRYNAAGAPTGAEFRINTAAKGSRKTPSIAPLRDGGFVVAWASFGQDGSAWGIFGQRFNGSGGRVGTEFKVNRFTEGAQQSPSVAGLGTGGFAVAWQSADQDGSKSGVYGRVYGANGETTQVNDFRANTFTYASQGLPSVSGVGDTGFVISWQSFFQDFSQWGIYAQRFVAKQ